MTSALGAKGVRKRFGPTVALDGVELSVEEGEVHALVGENGAGKSTLMKILAGVHPSDAGEITLFGRPYAPSDPRGTREAGVAMIYQELNLALDLTVGQNVVLGREAHRWGFLRPSITRACAEEALALLARDAIPIDTVVGRLSPADRQIVEIARALAADARLLVMDEPTSSLSAMDAERLLTTVRHLASRGIAVIYISHFLEEVKRVADRYTVLRDGRTVETGDVEAASTEHLVETMVGRALGAMYPKRSRPLEEIVLTVEGMSGPRLPRDATFELRAGEVLGIAGLVGAGRTETLRTLFGLSPMRRGRVERNGATDHGAPPHRRIAQGFGMLSEDRKGEGLALDRSLAENLTLPTLGRHRRAGLLDPRRLEAASAHYIELLGIRCAGPKQRVGALSGGNQQKVALSRLMHQGADVLLLDEPTRGIDVASKAEVYGQMNRLAVEGKSLIFVSSYLPELMGVADRIAVMHRGELLPARDVTDRSDIEILREATQGAPS